jgi:hypothetical protein
LIYEREVSVGHGNRYTAIHPYFFKAAFLDPRTQHFLRKILAVDNFNRVCRSLLLAGLCTIMAHVIVPVLFSSPYS